MMKQNNRFMTHTFINVTFTKLVLSLVRRPIDMNGINKTYCTIFINKYSTCTKSAKLLDFNLN